MLGIQTQATADKAGDEAKQHSYKDWIIPLLNLKDYTIKKNTESINHTHLVILLPHN